MNSLTNSRGCVRRRLLLLLAILLPGVGLAQLNWVGAGAKVSQATLVYYAPGEVKPLLTIRSEQIYGTYQKRGFFRIGVLPMVAVEGLEFELHDPGRVFMALTNAPDLLGQMNPRGALEIRHFSLHGTGMDRAGLTAKTLRITGGTMWILGAGSLRRADGTELLFSRATLTVAGPQTGELVCATALGTAREWLRFYSPSNRKVNINP